MKQPPCCIQGSAEPGLDSPRGFPQPEWPGPVAQVRTAGQKDGRTASAARGAQEGLSSRVIPTDPAAALGGSSGPIWRSVSPGFYSPTRISTARNHWLFLWRVCRAAVCYSLPSSIAPHHGTAKRAPQPSKEGSH